MPWSHWIFPALFSSPFTVAKQLAHFFASLGWGLVWSDAKWMHREHSGRWHEGWSREPKIKTRRGEKNQACLTKMLFLGRIRCITELHTMKMLVPKLSVHKFWFINPSARCWVDRVPCPAGSRSVSSKQKLHVWSQCAHTGQGCNHCIIFTCFPFLFTADRLLFTSYSYYKCN